MRRIPHRAGRGRGMIASNRCSFGSGWWVVRKAIIPDRKGTCSSVPDRESRRGFGGSGLREAATDQDLGGGADVGEGAVDPDVVKRDAEVAHVVRLHCA